MSITHCQAEEDPRKEEAAQAKDRAGDCRPSGSARPHRGARQHADGGDGWRSPLWMKHRLHLPCYLFCACQAMSSHPSEERCFCVYLSVIFVIFFFPVLNDQRCVWPESSQKAKVVAHLAVTLKSINLKKKQRNWKRKRLHIVHKCM